MRKLISLGLLAILLSMLTNPAMAIVEDCDELKEDGITKALVGLCIAYWSADNGRSQEQILANYRKKMRTGDPGDRNDSGDPDMPGLVDASCPCWPGDEMANAIDVAPAFECQLSKDPVLAIYGATGSAYFSVNLFAPASCFYFGPGAIVDRFFISVEEEQACRDGIQALVDEDFQDITCT